MVVGGSVGGLVVVAGPGGRGDVLLSRGLHGRLQVDGGAVLAGTRGLVQLAWRLHGGGLGVVVLGLMMRHLVATKRSSRLSAQETRRSCGGVGQFTTGGKKNLVVR